MAYTITQENIENEFSGNPVSAIVVQDTTSGSVAIAIDYSSKINRIADTLDVIENSLSSIETHVSRLRNLADPTLETDSKDKNGTGIRVSSPYTLLEKAITWFELFEKNNPLFNETETVSAEDLQRNLDLLKAWAEKIETNLADLK